MKKEENKISFNSIDDIDSLNSLDNKIISTASAYDGLTTPSKTYNDLTTTITTDRSINNIHWVYNTNPNNIPIDYVKLIADVDDKLADMEGRLDVLVNDCAFKNDLDSIHSLISNLVNENTALRLELDILQRNFTTAMNEISDLQLKFNEMLNLISNL